MGDDVALIDAAVASGELCLPPPVLSELLSKPDQAQIETLLSETPLMELTPGFWERAGQSRRVLRQHGLRAPLADALIAQCCIDADLPLIARDRDYRHFERWCGLKLAAG